MELAQVLAALRKGWWLVVLGSLLGVGGAVGANTVSPVQYRASVQLFVSMADQSGSDGTAGVLSGSQFALGTTNEMPFYGMIHGAGVMGLADGPTEVHKVTIARQVLREYRGTDEMWPTEWIPGKIEAARAKYAEYLEHEVGNL